MPGGEPSPKTSPDGISGTPCVAGSGLTCVFTVVGSLTGTTARRRSHSSPVEGYAVVVMCSPVFALPAVFKSSALTTWATHEVELVGTGGHARYRGQVVTWHVQVPTSRFGWSGCSARAAP